MKEQREPTPTRQTMMVLSVLIDNRDPLSGSALASATDLASGTLYPILIRLETAKWIQSEWEEASSPRRRLYGVTALGARRFRKEAMAWKPFVERFA